MRLPRQAVLAARLIGSLLGMLAFGRPAIGQHVTTLRSTVMDLLSSLLSGLPLAGVRMAVVSQPGGTLISAPEQFWLTGAHGWELPSIAWRTRAQSCQPARHVTGRGNVRPCSGADRSQPQPLRSNREPTPKPQPDAGGHLVH